MSFSNGGNRNNNNNNTNANQNKNVSIPQLIRLTQGNNNNDRNAAQSQLKYLEQSHFANYMMELVRILGSQQSSDDSASVRQGAGLLLLQSVKSNVFNRQRWMKLDSSQRAKLKAGILAVLGVDVVEARSTAVNVISNLALMEGVESEWRDLMPYLIEKCLSKPPNRALMHSSLKCIGQLAEMGVDISSYSGKMLECIAHGMSCHGASDVQSESMKCLYQIISLISGNMDVDKERRIIFQMVCCGGSSGANEVRMYSFMCISRLIEYYYDLCEPFMQSIFQISKTAIAAGIAANEDENGTKQAIEIWSTIAEIEFGHDKSFGFINKSLELLVPIYLSALLQQKEEFDEDEWTIRKAAACSLELFALVARDNVLQYVLKFVECNIGLSNWHNREAALCAFGCVLDGPSRDKLCELVSQILSAILKLMRDDHEQVRISAVWTFGRICELIPAATSSLASSDVLGAVLSALDDRSIISNKACWCIASLSKESAFCAGQTGYNLICRLLSRGRRSDTDCTLIIGIHEAINGVIYCQESSNDMLSSLLPELVEQMKGTLGELGDAKEGESRTFLEYKLAGLLSSIQVILDKLGSGCLSSDVSNAMMGCVVAAVGTKCDLVYEEALGLITHIARCIGNNFHIYLVTPPIQQVLIDSIRSGVHTNHTANETKQICRIGVGVAGDVYTQCAPFIAQSPQILRPFSDRCVSELLTILINNSIGMELKSHIVDALTDILIAHGQYAYRYSADILDKCLTIGCLTPPKDAHKDDHICKIFNEIRVSIVDTTRSCLAELASQSNKQQDFAKYIAQINKFFGATANDLQRTNLDVIKRCCRLLSEAADYCQGNQQLKMQLRTNEIQKILQFANITSKQTNDQELAKEALNAFQQLK
eukprot:466022_1